jgi:hypothetical protein
MCPMYSLRLQQAKQCLSMLLLISQGSMLCCCDVLLESIHSHTWRFGPFGLVEGAMKEEPLA